MIEAENFILWNALDPDQKNDYKVTLLSICALSPISSQKSDGKNIAPVLSSKAQETAFQQAFNATPEDIKNTSFDASLKIETPNGELLKVLVGIKTFLYSTSSQKVAQFKAKNAEWSQIVAQILRNQALAQQDPSQATTLETKNEALRLELVKHICTVRNIRIQTSKANLRGFDIKPNEVVHTVYHVVMLSGTNEDATLYIAETSYDEINTDNITITHHDPKMRSLTFTDGKHRYRYTSADCQLYMDFDNKNIVLEKCPIIYHEDPFNFLKMGQYATLQGKNPVEILAQAVSGDLSAKSIAIVTESHSWPFILHPCSGLNSSYGLGYRKKGKQTRHNMVEGLRKLPSPLSPSDNEAFLEKIEHLIELKGFTPEVENTRNELYAMIKNIPETDEFKTRAMGILFRPKNEVYIPILGSKKFHEANPDFFGPNYGTFKPDDPNKLAIESPKERRFELCFQPSGHRVTCFLAQDNGKAIESEVKQSILGEWILRQIFQVEPYHKLTEEHLNNAGINGYRLYKLKNDDTVYLEFIWLDEDETKPEDFMAWQQ